MRLSSLDALRGLIMIIMALDHTRDFFHSGAMTFSPEDLAKTTPLLFFTRWITHFCAPVFMFAAGAASYLWLQRGHTKGELSNFLWKRGLWLVVLEFTAFRFAIFFSLTEGPVFLSVLWALGLSMVILAALIHLPLRWLTVLSVATITLHNLFDTWNPGSILWNILHRIAFFPVAGAPVISSYPLIPWFAVMALGYCFGSILQNEPSRRRRQMLYFGLAATAGFVVLRALNFYGDPVPWTSGLLSFLRVNKYPPSLLYLLMTLGPALITLTLLDRRERSLPHPLIVFGRVPLFFFLLHFYAIHLLTIPFAWVKYGQVAFLFTPTPSMGGNAKLFPPEYGYDLPTTYAVWVFIVVACYPVCLWFARLKQRRRDWWLSYL